MRGPITHDRTPTNGRHHEHVLATRIDIDATPEQTWGVLSDFPQYGEWSNFSSVAGTAVLGTRLRMRMPGMAFTSTVTAAVPGEELQWSAKILADGLFLGQHTFTLARKDDGTTRLDNVETFSGALTKPFEEFFARNHNAGGYAAFNRALKSRVEGRVRETTARAAGDGTLRTA